MVAFAGWSEFCGDGGCNKPKAASCCSEATGFCSSLEGETGTGGDPGRGVSSPNTFTMMKMDAAPMIQFLAFDNDNCPQSAAGSKQNCQCLSSLKLWGFLTHHSASEVPGLSSLNFAAIVGLPRVRRLTVRSSALSFASRRLLADL